MTAFKKINPYKKKIKLDREVIENICNSLRAGAYIETAVVMAGVCKKTFYLWIKKAHTQRRGLCRDLLHAVEAAQEQSTMRDLLVIDACANGENIVYKEYPDGSVDENGRDISGHVMLDGKGKPIILKYGSKKDWSASAWRLQRKNPQQWGLKETVDHTSSDGSLNINFTKSKHKEKE